MNKLIKEPFIKGYKFPIYPTVEQQKLFENTFGCCRYVYNRAIVETKIEYDFYLETKRIGLINNLQKPDTSSYCFVKKLIKYKADINSLWLNDAIAVSLQQTMLHLGSAFSTFFNKHKKYPKFKKKNNRQSLTLAFGSFRFKEDKFYVAKSKEPLKIGFSRELPSNPKSCVITKTPSGKYYISFICEYFPIRTNGNGKIGIDLGLKDFLVTSDGIKIRNPKYFKKYEARLKRAQQALSSKKKGSANRKKARIKVAKIHELVTNARNDFLHKLSRKLVNENQVIGLERLKVSNMVRNHSLAKSISNAAWSSFTSMINYKARESQNCTIVYMDMWYPSTRICHVDKIKLDRKLTLSERVWTCPKCNSIHDRDINAAINIKDKAIEMMSSLLIPNNACIQVIVDFGKD